MNFFEKVFTFIANLSTKMPDIDFKTYFIVVVAFLIGVCLICALTFLGSKIFKLQLSCSRIENFLKEVECIDDDNAAFFTEKCFTKKAPQSLRDAWIEYSGVRFGYPSEILSEKNVFDKELGKTVDIRAKIFLAIGFVVLAFFSFWGYGKLASSEMGVIHFVGLIILGAGYFALMFLNKKLITKAHDYFEDMQEDLDAKVDMQIERDFATDSSPLLELSSLVDEIVGRNTEKEIIQQQEETPIESLIRTQMEAAQTDSIEPETHFSDALTDLVQMSEEPEEDEFDSFGPMDGNVPTDDIDEEETDDTSLNVIDSQENASPVVTMEEINNQETENTMREKTVDVSMKGKSENLFNALNFSYDVPEQEKQEWLDSVPQENEDAIDGAIDLSAITDILNEKPKEEGSKESKFAKLLGVMDYINNTNTSQQMKDQIIAMLEEVANKKNTKKSDVKIINECIDKLKK